MKVNIRKLWDNVFRAVAHDSGDGFVLNEHGEYDNVTAIERLIAGYEQMLSEQPNEDERCAILYSLACVYKRVGRYAEAKRTLELIQQRGAAAANMLARVLANLGHEQDARKLMMTLNSEHADRHWQITEEQLALELQRGVKEKDRGHAEAPGELAEPWRGSSSPGSSSPGSSSPGKA